MRNALSGPAGGVTQGRSTRSAPENALHLPASHDKDQRITAGFETAERIAGIYDFETILRHSLAVFIA